MKYAERLIIFIVHFRFRIRSKFDHLFNSSMREPDQENFSSAGKEPKLLGPSIYPIL